MARAGGAPPCCCAPRAVLPIMRTMKTIRRTGRETDVSIDRDASARARLVCRAAMRSCAELVALLASVALHAEEWTYTYTPRTDTTAQDSGERPLFDREAASLQQLDHAPSRHLFRVWLVLVAGPHAQVIWQRGTDKLRTAGDRVRDGDRLYAGDAISTGDDSSLALQFADTSRLVLGPRSTLVLEAFAGDGHTASKFATVLRLARGRLEHHIAEGLEQPYYIITLAAMASRTSVERGPRTRREVSANCRARLLSSPVLIASPAYSRSPSRTRSPAVRNLTVPRCQMTCACGPATVACRSRIECRDGAWASCCKLAASRSKRGRSPLSCAVVSVRGV